ncbi:MULTISPECIES: VOC family protein [unclassified Streptomyces]|uniref:VOC family protein n=1 Tax=unclassified Streptomyces TaxID=2593676 RepID=UPI001E4CF0A1|nr:VOC family protein [Streptomyces sp. CB02980]MCB8907684.1 VOC family protein [Streptomyces sp. CB02980]
MARDLAAAQHFYSGVLGWEFRASSLGGGFSVALHEGVPVAGIGALAERLDMPVAWTPYFAVVNADIAAAQIRERGATMAVGPLAFGTGRAGLAADPAGAVFGFWQGTVVPDWSVGRGSAPAWLELHTRDASEASIFYGEVLDWAGGGSGCCVASHEHDHVVLRHGHDTVARISGGAVGAAPDPSIRPRWHVHFPVPDLEEAIEATNGLGGGAVAPVGTSTTSRWVNLTDPDGAQFTVVAPQGTFP